MRNMHLLAGNMLGIDSITILSENLKFFPNLKSLNLGKFINSKIIVI